MIRKEGFVLFAKLKIGTKISLGFAIILLILLILSGNSFFSLKSSQQQLAQIGSANDRLVTSLKIDSAFTEAVSSVRAYIAYGDEKYLAQAEEQLQTALALETVLLEKAREEKKPEVRQLMEQTEQYKNMASRDLAPLVRTYHQKLNAGDYAQASQIKDQYSHVLKTMIPFATQINSLTSKFAGYNEEIFNNNLKLSLKDSEQIIFLSLVISVVALAVGIALSTFLTRMIRNPIIEMLAGARKYAAGDLSQTIPVTAKDELGELATAFNQMRQSFVAMLQNIATSAEQVAAASEQLTASADQSAQAANQVAVTITAVAQGSEQQLLSVQESSTAVQGMSANFQQVSVKAKEVTYMADQTSSSAKQGSLVVSDAIRQMTSIQENVMTSAQVVSKLGERSKEIGQIVNTIASIAGQTNLLALNAAIEAARAGEQGRGFAVVAEEVRKLAEQSEGAADQIAAMIQEVQYDTDQAVSSMDNGTREVKAGTDVVQRAGQAFHEIEALVNQVLHQLNSITAAIQQAANNTNQIVDSVQAIDQVSRNTASQTQTVAAATQEQSASMEEIASSSQTLAKMAEDLQTAVHQFKL